MNNSIVLGEMIEGMSWETVWSRLSVLYPKYTRHERRFRRAFDYLKKYDDRQQTDYQIRVRIGSGREGSRFIVHGWVPSEKGEFSIELANWEEWLEMTFCPETIAFCSEADMISHALVEMTVFGYTPDRVKQARHELETSLKENNREISEQELRQKIYARVNL